MSNGIKSTLSDIGKFVSNTANDVGSFVGSTANDIGKFVGNTAGEVGKFVGTTANGVGTFVNTTVKTVQSITPDEVLTAVMQAPGAKVDRAQYLQKELIRYCKPNVVQNALDSNPAMAGLDRNLINKIAGSAIDLETTGVVALSTAAGIPGGAAIAATIPADVYQYFMAILRVMQKLAYLYGYPAFSLNSNSIDDETKQRIFVFLGVMFGVNGAQSVVGKLSESIAKNIAKKLPQQALTKTAIYPIVKKIASKVGIQMTKQIYANALSDVIPVVGAAISGGISWATFAPAAKRLQKEFMKLDISDPEFYKKDTTDVDADSLNNVADIEILLSDDSNITDVDK